jgi:hypothetical protein
LLAGRVYPVCGGAPSAWPSVWLAMSRAEACTGLGPPRPFHMVGAIGEPLTRIIQAVTGCQAQGGGVSDRR